MHTPLGSYLGSCASSTVPFLIRFSFSICHWLVRLGFEEQPEYCWKHEVSKLVDASLNIQHKRVFK